MEVMVALGRLVTRLAWGVWCFSSAWCGGVWKCFFFLSLFFFFFGGELSVFSENCDYVFECVFLFLFLSMCDSVCLCVDVCMYDVLRSVCVFLFIYQGNVFFLLVIGNCTSGFFCFVMCYILCVTSAYLILI